MIALLPLFLWLGAQAPAPLHCRIELRAGQQSARCTVQVPSDRKIRPCTAADRQAGHCAKSGGARERFVAWVVASGQGNCRITDKKTKWKRGVVSAKLTAPAGTTCDLYVETQ